MIIRFTSIEGEDLGYAEFRDGVLTGSTEARQAEIDRWMQEGYTPEEFVEYFREWTNGYVASLAE